MLLHILSFSKFKLSNKNDCGIRLRSCDCAAFLLVVSSMLPGSTISLTFLSDVVVREINLCPIMIFGDKKSENRKLQQLITCVVYIV